MPLSHRAFLVPLAVGAGLIAGPAGAADAVDLVAGEAQFKKSCGTCHGVEAGAPARQGPNLSAVFGSKAGAQDAFPKYSAALKKAGAEGLAWDEATLDAWLTNASKLVPGSVMPYRQTDAAKRKLVIDYLKSVAPAKAP